MSVDTAPPSSPAAPAPEAPRDLTTWLVGAGIALVVVVALVLTGALLTDDRDAPAHRPDRIVSAPLAGGPSQVTFELLTGATAVTVRTVDLPGMLYRIETPQGGSHTPYVTGEPGTVALHLLETGVHGPSTVTVELSRAVTWHLRMVGGVTDEVLDLETGSIGGVELVGGATSIDLTLPRPTGTVPVRMSGGASRWAVRVPADVPVRVSVGSGAGSLSVDGASRGGTAAGTVVAPAGWDSAADRYAIDAQAGVATFTVERL
jgi:hypothetical protein